VSAIEASQLLRPRLLDGVSILLATASPGAPAHGSFAEAVDRVCAGLDARVRELGLSVFGEGGEGAIEQAAQEAVERALADSRTLELLVIDCASVFSMAGAGPDGGGTREDAREALRACLELAWDVTRAVAGSAFLPDARGGRIVYLAPPADGGEHVDAACAGLENLARTLSIEWARHGITPVTIAPGTSTIDEVAALTAYLASPAGAYFSGCVLDLSGGARRCHPASPIPARSPG
jgi:NAD(P)-dependent dehydrogenase (short-subunit alcohol dehydrogenase family)